MRVTNKQWLNLKVGYLLQESWPIHWMKINDTLNTRQELISILSISVTIAFHATMTSYDTIYGGSAVLFNEVLLNQGNGKIYVLLSLCFVKILCLNSHVIPKN